MGAINNNAQPLDPLRDFTGRLADIAQQLQALDRCRKATAAVRKVLTAPIVNRVEADMQAIERIRRLSQVPLPEFKDEE